MFAFVFESVGSGEWLVLLAVILIIVGPKNLPSAARKMGQVMSKLRRAADEFKRQIMTMDEEMKKTADEIKREYIDIPEDGASTGGTDTSNTSDASDGESETGDSSSDYSDYPDDYYPNGYPDADYYGETDASGDSPPPAEEPAAAAAPESVAAAAPEPEPAAAPEPTPPPAEKTNG